MSRETDRLLTVLEKRIEAHINAVTTKELLEASDGYGSNESRLQVIITKKNLDDWIAPMRQELP